MEPLLHGVEQRTLVLAGGLDLLLPSAQEGGRLARLMPRAFCITQPARSHLMLCEPGFDLVEALQREGFCAAERRQVSGACGKHAAHPAQCRIMYSGECGGRQCCNRR